jgi:hypothetical protein
VYIWETSNTFVPTGVAKSIKGARKDKNMSYEHYPATNSSPPIVTVAMFAPAGAYAIARQGAVSAGGFSTFLYLPVPLFLADLMINCGFLQALKVAGGL